MNSLVPSTSATAVSSKLYIDPDVEIRDQLTLAILEQLAGKTDKWTLKIDGGYHKLIIDKPGVRCYYTYSYVAAVMIPSAHIYSQTGFFNFLNRCLISIFEPYLVKYQAGDWAESISGRPASALYNASMELMIKVGEENEANQRKSELAHAKEVLRDALEISSDL